ncbi:hypothetical protein OGATHE_001502, partial [Ogataea polymorpha]
NNGSLGSNPATTKNSDVWINASNGFQVLEVLALLDIESDNTHRRNEASTTVNTKRTERFPDSLES